MTGPLILRERDGSQEAITSVRPDPPESDTIVKRAQTWRREYHFVGYEDGTPVYAAAGGHLS